MEKITKTFTKTLITFIKFYQYLLRPFIGHYCRFTPTCSNYAIDALKVYGPIKGMLRIIYRLIRCNPWANGGHDPIIKMEQKCRSQF